MQFRDLKKQYEVLKNSIDANIRRVLNDTNFIMGSQVEELENKLACCVGRKHCISVANGTDALILSLLVLGIGEGDAVFVPDFTYVASASCISAVGATPVFVDIDLDTFNMSHESLFKMIKKIKDEGALKPRAVIPVDLFGLPADYDNILKIAKDNNLFVIEDAAQGFGGMIRNKKACSFGDISCTSFFPAKPLGCYGDGGAIFTDDDKIDDTLRSLRANGKSKEDKYNNIMIGRNSRLDTIQAAILLTKLEVFDKETKDINNIAKEYNNRLKNYVKTPYIPKDFYSSYAQYTILFQDENERNVIQKKLKSNNIPSMLYYPICMHNQKCFSNIESNLIDYNNSIEATKRVLSLPMHPYLTIEDIDTITNAIKKP